MVDDDGRQSELTWLQGTNIKGNEEIEGYNVNEKWGQGDVRVSWQEVRQKETGSWS